MKIKRMKTEGKTQSGGIIVAAVLLTSLIILNTNSLYASSGTEGAAFLDIPVGGTPASLGSAYTALANDAYAPTWNPGGLGFLDSTQLSGQHISYLESMSYEYLSFVHPLGNDGRAFGAAIQYLTSGDIPGTDDKGNPTGDFSSHYGAYSLAYGQALSEKLSIGATGKWINAKISDVSANAYAVDFGGMYRMNRKLTLAATLTNVGTKLTFLSEGDTLPLAVHVGGAYQLNHQLNLVAEGVYRKTGLASVHFGGEWQPMEMIALRAGYKTDTVKENTALAGLTTGIGIKVWGQELDYAWVPLGELGDTHYFSLVMRFGEAERSKRNLIQYQNIKKHRTADYNQDHKEEQAPEYQQLMELLNESEQRAAKANFGLPLSGNELQ
jgi:hypothetical protein